MSAWTLVEPCCGSAALTMHLLGRRRQVVPYQGSKWRARRTLAGLAAELGFAGRPGRVHLVDAGPWGATAALLTGGRVQAEVLAAVRALAEEDPGALFARLQGAPVPWAPVPFAAEHLVLQRLAFSGKAVGVVDGRWSSPGLNRTSAYGTPATARFGAVRPQLLALCDVLAEEVAPVKACGVRGDAACALGMEVVDGPVLVYLDPPYVGTTAYPGATLDRAGVERHAAAWAARGAAVIVSEACALDLGPGWRSRQLMAGRGGASPFRGTAAEWVTFRGPA